MRNFGQSSGYGVTAQEMANRRKAAYDAYANKVGGTFNDGESGVNLSVNYAQGDIVGCDEVVIALAERVAGKGGGAHMHWIGKARDVVAKVPSGSFELSTFIEKMRQGESMGSYSHANVTPEEHYCMLAVQWFEHFAAKGETPPYATTSQISEQVANRWQREGFNIPANNIVNINAGNNSHESIEMSNQGKAQLQAAVNAGMHHDEYEAMLISQGKPIWHESLGTGYYIEYPYTGTSFEVKVNANGNGNANSNSNSNGNNSNAAWYDDTTNVALVVAATVVLGGAFWYIRQDKGQSPQRGSMSPGYDQSVFNHPIINPFF
jgi:hypothetical protein